MTKKLPQPGEVYLHFKGTEYRIIGVAKTRRFNSLYAPDYWAKDSENQEILEVFRIKKELIISLPYAYCLENLNYVIYQQVNDLTKIWARDLDNFLDKVGNEFRFKYVGDVVTFH